MDYQTERVTEVITLYHLLAVNEISYVGSETSKFLKNQLLPALSYEVLGDTDDESDDAEDDTDDSEINSFTLETARRFQEMAGGIIQPEGKDSRSKIILEQLVKAADEVSTWQDKPLVCQLVSMWHIVSSGPNPHKKVVIDLLKEKWKIKDDLIAEMSDTAETLADLKENCQKAVQYTPKNVFSVFVKNIFRKNKIPDRKKNVAAEYRNDEQALLVSIQQLFATEAVKS